MSSNPFSQRLVVKGGTKMSLHERFSHLTTSGSGGPVVTRAATVAPQRPSAASTSVLYGTGGRRAMTNPPQAVARQANPRFDYYDDDANGYDSLEEEPRHSYYSAAAAAPTPARNFTPRFAPSTAAPMRYSSYSAAAGRVLPPGHWRGAGAVAGIGRRRQLFEAANRVKRKAIMHRLGVRREQQDNDPLSHIPYLSPLDRTVGGQVEEEGQATTHGDEGAEAEAEEACFDLRARTT